MVDVANVMGARADGWWRDRAGAALRLCGRSRNGLAGVPAARMPGDLPAPAAWVMVLEGQARAAAASLADGAPAGLLVAAPGSGDDTIVAEVASLAAASAYCLW